jgi:hypothetical protein
VCFPLLPEPLDVSRNVINSVASSLRNERGNRQLPFSNRRRQLSFKTTVSLFQDADFRPHTPWNCATNRAKELDVICLKKQTSINKIFILVINLLDTKNLFYNKFISCLYMFRAPCALSHEVKIVLCSLLYLHTCRWPSGAKSSLNLCTDGHLQVWCYQRLHNINFVLLTMST